MFQNIIESLRSYALQHNVPVIDDPTRQYIEEILQEHKPLHCLEIGSAIWYSTLCIAQKISTWGGQITSFECSYPSYIKAIHTIKTTQLSNILLYRWDFLKFSRAILPISIDFLFIDAEKSSYLDYYLFCKPFLADNCIVIFDDVIKFTSKTANLLTYLRTNAIWYEILQISDDDGILLIEKK